MRLKDRNELSVVSDQLMKPSSASFIANFLSINLRKKMSGFLPVVIVIIGLLFIIRGLNLGIPYLSPTEDKIEMNMERTKKLQQSKEIDFKDQEIDLNSGKQMNCCGS